VALEFSSDNVVSPSLFIENEHTARQITISAQGNALTFVGTGGVPLTFVGTGGALTFVAGGLQLVRRTAAIRGQYLGITLTGTEPVWTLSALGMEVRAGGKWNPTRN
jgi:hypothetical protein